MKHLMITTAFVALTAVPLHAGTDAKVATSAEAEYSFMVQDTQHELSQLLGARVYIQDQGTEAEVLDVELTEPRENWEDIGEIGEAYLSDTGEMSSVIVDVGGFLGLGERHVEIDPSELMFLPDADDEGAFFVLYTGPKADLETKQVFDFDVPLERSIESARERMEQARAQSKMKADALDEEPHAMVDTLKAEDRDTLTAEDLQGLAIYDANDEHVGEISELVLSSEGKISKLIVDVGGFLGLGEKPVALDFDAVTLMRVDGGMKAETNATMKELEAMETWQE